MRNPIRMVGSKGSDLLDIVVELKVQHCREIFQDLFGNNETFLLCTSFKLECKVKFVIFH